MCAPVLRDFVCDENKKGETLRAKRLTLLIKCCCKLRSDLIVRGLRILCGHEAADENIDVDVVMLDFGIERRHFHFEQPRGAHLIAMRERERTLD